MLHHFRDGDILTASQLNDNFKAIKIGMISHKDRNDIDCNLHVFEDGHELNIDHLNENFSKIAEAIRYSYPLIQCSDNCELSSWYLNENFQRLYRHTIK